MKGPKNPDVFKCANPECKRPTPLSLQDYSAPYPDKDVPPVRVHRVVISQYPGFCLLCTRCAHYTVVSPTKWKQAGKKG